MCPRLISDEAPGAVTYPFNGVCYTAGKKRAFCEACTYARRPPYGRQGAQGQISWSQLCDGSAAASGISPGA